MISFGDEPIFACSAGDEHFSCWRRMCLVQETNVFNMHELLPYTWSVPYVGKGGAQAAWPSHKSTLGELVWSGLKVVGHLPNLPYQLRQPCITHSKHNSILRNSLTTQYLVLHNH